MTVQRKRRSPGGGGKSTQKSTALSSFNDIREMALALPGVEDGTSYGTAAVKVGGRLFARQHQSMDCVVLRCELLDREILMQSAPDAFFITDHYRDHPWILLRLGAVDKRELPELIERAWRLVASKTLIKKHDAERRLP
ncbi:MAG TPA: MmcQ/YjbR family DNA-binding protein [Steroidobacteraceae bacterium]